jgi:enhancing lycopene biosynthesis protein 2
MAQVSKKLCNRVAVVLSGCGVYDGSEIHEASACLVHLSRHGADVSMFAPDKPQLHVINHLKGEPTEGETRNVLVESARIARGSITSLAELKVDSFDAVVFPGGFGAAKNLCTFATENANMTVDGEVERIINEFIKAKKPLGFTCIAPVLASKVIPGVELTVGMDKDDNGKWPYAGTAEAVQAMGSKHFNREVTVSIYTL